MATVSTKMVLDTTGFNRGIKSAESSMSKFKSMAGGAAMAGIAAGFAAAAAATVGLAAGIKNVLDIGGALSDLSTRTGIAAGELRVLQEAFKQNGLSAEQVGPAVNKLQRALVEAGQKGGEVARTFEGLGINLNDLRGMNAADQFQAIGAAINALPDPAARAAAAMQIFGRSGGELLTLFSNSGALTQAATTVGAQADLLTKNANMFDQASDILGSVGAKLEGFFVGVADQLVPALMPMLEAANGLDFAGIGQAIGNGIGFALTAITSGQIGNLLTAQLKLSGAQFANTLYAGVIGAMAFLVQRMIDAPADFLKVLEIVKKPEFWQGMGNALIAAALGFGRTIMGFVADVMGVLSEVPRLKELLEGPMSSVIGAMDAMGEEQAARQGAASQQLSGPLGEIRAQAKQSFGRAVAAAIEAMDGASQIDTGKLRKKLEAVIATISSQQEANAATARARFGATKTATPLFDAEGTGGAGKSNTGVIAQSLQKVGGGAAFARFSDSANPAAEAVREQKKSNGYLQTIAEGINYIRNKDGALMPA
jgi:hypothetical protein